MIPDACARVEVARLTSHANLEEWRAQARTLLQRKIAPDRITWCGPDDASLLALENASAEAGSAALPCNRARVPREFLDLAERVIAHRDSQRFALLYRILWRLSSGEHKLLALLTDPDVQRARVMAQGVRRDAHKMKAFVRFREILVDNATTYVAWFEPEHFIVDYVAPFFTRRFTGMRFSILTPYRSAHWDLASLSYGPGLTREQAPTRDDAEDWWRTYYSSIFNPARLNVRAMQAEMPQKYWKNLPEAELIAKLIVNAPAHTQSMIERAPSIPRKRIAPYRDAGVATERSVGGSGFGEVADGSRSLVDLRKRARDCRRCPLWQPATQAVFGEGPEHAETVFIGEQPGDKEDLCGKPFAGPAGQLLDRALLEVGVDRAAVYITNTVKHFKFEPRGKIRLHMRASTAEQLACRQWLDAELDAIKPRRIVCLGAMAAQAILGKSFRLLSERGQWRTLESGVAVLATVHPSYLLRLPAAQFDDGYSAFVRDLSLLPRAIDGD